MVTMNVKECPNCSNDIVLYPIETVVGDKPKYEVGSAATLSFGKKLADQKAKVAAVWTISNDDEDEEEAIIDADELLDEEDLVKPDPSSNRGECGHELEKYPFCLFSNQICSRFKWLQKTIIHCKHQYI